MNSPPKSCGFVASRRIAGDDDAGEDSTSSLLDDNVFGMGAVNPPEPLTALAAPSTRCLLGTTIILAVGRCIKNEHGGAANENKNENKAFESEIAHLRRTFAVRGFSRRPPVVVPPFPRRLYAVLHLV